MDGIAVAPWGLAAVQTEDIKSGWMMIDSLSLLPIGCWIKLLLLFITTAQIGSKWHHQSRM